MIKDSKQNIYFRITAMYTYKVIASQQQRRHTKETITTTNEI